MLPGALVHLIVHLEGGHSSSRIRVSLSLIYSIASLLTQVASGVILGRPILRR